jgi:DNA-binding NtrC family response regulator
MPPRKRQATILVLDSELGFLFALSHELARREISAFPARSAAEARGLIAQFDLKVDLVVMNCARAGACKFAEELTGQNAALKVIGIVADGRGCEECADRLSARFRDPEDRDPKQIVHCAEVIEMLVRGRRSRAHRAGTKD